ncbi:uroporphyrinogen-III synthase [Calothrix sp. 336/3]|uniref:uroporphyrinogen-III synthase n=1 Tax=Calothrix sp. 336/3 TaxID=1337936 RepID=UPI0005542D32|nr:uroporphyrinogen-III synthase [Calothrix sp. 336/3]
MVNSLPLSGKTILVTRAAGQSSSFTQMLTAVGAEVIEMPTLEIGEPSSWELLDRAIATLTEFHWLILTSTNAVEYFTARLKQQGKNITDLSTVKIAVVGEKTANCLQKYHLKADFIPPNYVADSLVENFPETLLGKKILFPRVESGGREVLVKEFSAKGADVVEVPAYQSCCPKTIPASAELALKSQQINVITFASSKTVQFFCQLLTQKFAQNSEDSNYIISEIIKNITIASIGPQTSKTCFALFGRVDIEAEEYTLEGLVQGLIKWGVGENY